ncbi:hypothetical protein [Oceanobacillus kimchii]|uniref:hypothetical protein n=1 Tax=Oceanobacillus kimchii TaxID=746691 RepID=UPI00232B6F35|nr:hypothetical protein [Oceanobacillus kimchii]
MKKFVKVLRSSSTTTLQDKINDTINEVRNENGHLVDINFNLKSDDVYVVILTFESLEK